MYNYKILCLYLFKKYIKYFIVTVSILIAFLSLSNVFEVMQTFKGYNISLPTFFNLMLLKVPYLLNAILPLLSFISMLLFLTDLNKHNELIIIIENGISIGKLLIIPIIASLLIGTLFVSIVSPLSTYGLQKLERLHKRITKKNHSELAVLKSNVLFFENYMNQNRIIKAQSIDFELKQLNNAIILILDTDNNLIKRIDADKINLESNNFIINNAKVFTNTENQVIQNLEFPTKLSIDNFVQRYKNLLPENIYIWDFPKIMNNFAKSGFPIREYKIYYYKQIFKPLYMVVMVILATCFLNFNNRSNNHWKIIILGLFTGIFVYITLEVSLKVLVSNGIQPIWAILLPILLIVMISNFVILHFY